MIDNERLQALGKWARAFIARVREVFERFAAAVADWGRRYFPAIRDVAEMFAAARRKLALMRATRRYTAMSARQRKDARRRATKRGAAFARAATAILGR